MRWQVPPLHRVSRRQLSQVEEEEESNAAGPSAEFSVVSQERVMNRLNAALNDLRVGYDEVGEREE